MITKKNIVRHELIGLFVRVEEARNENQVGTEGKVVDETRDTLRIEEKGKVKTIPKSGSVFIFELPSDGEVRINGDVIKSRPEDRIGKKYKKW